MLQRSVPQADLILSYWGRTPSRENTMAMLGGHIDYSPVLVTTKTTGSSSPSLMDRIQKFLKPFSWGCWVAVFAIIAFSGLTDFLLEYG